MKLRRVVVLTGLAMAVGAVWAGPASAAPPRPTEGIYACASIPEDAARLACFDKAVADLQTAEAEGKVRTVDVETIAKLERESFGFSLPSLSQVFGRSEDAGKPLTQEVEEVTLPIASISVNRVTRKAQITLENGQIWEQIDSEEISRSKIRKAKEATIQKAAFGSFLMTIGSGSGIRVRRVN
ncbi:hypothetical protein [Hyphomonas sp.]|uniref:hypothetical protein n=1 Tax=Hyphomonas sp. TaxID=87 RepID=UPI0025BB195B|nr:hypothetical protein [Hyphomonas sp.]MBI1401249.1 hypothetical protein [Hyphomonas sp.]